MTLLNIIIIACHINILDTHKPYWKIPQYPYILRVMSKYLENLHPLRAAAFAAYKPTAKELAQRAEWKAKHGAERAIELAEHALERKRRWRLRCRLEASKTAYHAAEARRATIVEHLRPMAKACLSFGEMARNLEASNVLTPRGNRRWTAQQAKMSLKHALLGCRPKALRDSYFPEGLGKRMPFPKVKPGKNWVPRKIKAKPPGDGGYAKASTRRRSKITKRPAR
jgi:hypothetical protein